VDDLRLGRPASPARHLAQGRIAFDPLPVPGERVEGRADPWVFRQGEDLVPPGSWDPAYDDSLLGPIAEGLVQKRLERVGDLRDHDRLEVEGRGNAFVDWNEEEALVLSLERWTYCRNPVALAPRDRGGRGGTPPN